MDTTLAKRKTSMVLYKIEEALGSYIFDHEHEVKSDSYGYQDIKIQDVVEKAYLDEIFQLVIKATKDTPEDNSIKRLYQLAHDLNLFEIRNAIAHPNRPFLDVYWYRVAAIAADPVFENLGVKDIKAILYSAEQGTIEDPPEGWEKKYTWDIPNNLPSKFESDITGLIGRNKELGELKDKISSPRNNTVAVIAPGGYGKTALVLDLLKDIVTTPDSTKWVDAVSYVTLKTETWENNSFVKIDAASEISAIEQIIADQLGVIFDEYIDDIDQAIESFADKRIILCIDNLETILRDDDQLFHSFIDRLPRDWKVVVTSRVVITNAFIYTLAELKEKPAIHLSRLYNRNKGGDELPQEKYAQIARDCYCNPLAIKMTLDLYLAGNEIPSSINEAKSNIAYFSFNNLIESLSENALKVIELIFIESEVNRTLICQILGLNVDAAATAINELSRTSLINRISQDDRERYEINGSIKDLLIINPKCLEIRAEIQGKINRQKTVSKEIDIQQKASNLPVWHFQYIPEDTEHGLKILLKDFAKIRFVKNTNKERVSQVYAQFRKHEENYKNNFLFLRAFARVLVSLQMVSEAESYYRSALSLSPNNMITKYLVARFFFDQSNFEKSLEIYLELVAEIEKIDATEENIPFHNTLYQGFFLSYLYKGDYEPVIEYTKKWKESKHFRGLFGTYRASAFKRKMENLANVDVQETINCLNSATKILDDVYRNEGYSQASAQQGYKVIEEIYYCLKRDIYSKNHPEYAQEFLGFCDKYLIDIVDSIKNKSAEDIISVATHLSEVHIKENPFAKKQFWKSYTKSISENAIEVSEISEPYELLKVVRVANNQKGGRTNFLFAEDARNNEYFVHFNTLENIDWSDWLSLQVGANIAAVDFNDVKGKTAKNVNRAFLVTT